MCGCVYVYKVLYSTYQPIRSVSYRSVCTASLLGQVCTMYMIIYVLYSNLFEQNNIILCTTELYISLSGHYFTLLLCTAACLGYSFCVYSSLFGLFILCVQQPVWTVHYFCVYSSLFGLSITFVCTAACLDCMGSCLGWGAVDFLPDSPVQVKTKENTIESKSILHMPYTVHILMGNLVFHFFIFFVDIIDSIYSLNRPDKHCMSLTLSPLQKFIS